LDSRNTALSLALSVVCFAAVWAIGQEFLALFKVEGRDTLSALVRFVAAMGIFALIFQAVMWMSNSVLRRWFSQESRLVGDWFQVFEILNYERTNDPLDAIRHGPVAVTESGSRLHIAAANGKAGGCEAPSTWYSDKISIQGGQLWLLFTSNGAGRGSTHGNMLFQTEGSRVRGKPQVLTGQFSDSSPATHYGTIRLYRDRQQYESYLQEVINRLEAVPE